MTRRPLLQRHIKILDLALNRYPDTFTTKEARLASGAKTVWPYLMRLINRGLLRHVRRGHYKAIPDEC